ncbi:MAG: lysine--tRNA ligase [Candidatus Buchananbacteria bacterium]
MLDEHQIRLQKLTELTKQGIKAYPNQAQTDLPLAQVIADFTALEKQQKIITVSGRLRSIRRQGAIAFAHLEDTSAKLQIFIKKDDLDTDYQVFKDFIDVGDFVQISGLAFLTKSGEKSLAVKKLKILAKTLRPLPEKWHGLKDRELRYRQRYLDLLANPEVKEFFIKRAQFIQNIRNFLNQQNFLEVETPTLEAVPGGADAEPFTTHHNTLDIDLYLRISLELHLKRLVVGGLDRVYELGKVFRNEGISTQHLQEFTLLEFYWAYQNYQGLMDFTEKFFVTVMEKTFGTLKTTYDGHNLDFAAPWPKLDYFQIFKEKTGLDLNTASQTELLDYAKKLKLDTNAKLGKGRLIDQIYKKQVRPFIIQPTFLINHPIEISPLAKKLPDNPNQVERFQVICAGVEIVNAFSELNDPMDQRERFSEQEKLRIAGDKEAQMIDEDYILALEHGLPPTAGFGAGIDRLLQIMTGQDSIRDTVLFPQMRPKE